MIRVFVSKKRNYPISIIKIKNKIKDFFISQGIVSDADVSIAIVSEREMLKIGRKYLSPREKLHNVLSFVPSETKGEFVSPPDDKIHLGEIVVCYPLALFEANGEGVLVEEKVIELLIHGAYHLMGIHHK